MDVENSSIRAGGNPNFTTLPGDVIAIGTPSGIGSMKPGDIIEVRIEKRDYVVGQASRTK